MPILEVSDLTMAYGGLTALEHLSFSVEEGDYLCIVGENGSGKSTLIKALLGLQSPKSGKIIYNGITPRDIGYLPQQTSVQRDFPATVWEVVLSGNLSKKPFWRPFYSGTERARAQKVLEQVGLSELRTRPIRALSGGQRQRVLIARALCAAKEMLILDEPAAALDPAASSRLYARIDHLNHEHGVTVLMVTHSLEAAHHAGKILYLGHHESFFGSTEEFFAGSHAESLNGGEDHV